MENEKKMFVDFLGGCFYVEIIKTFMLLYAFLIVLSKQQIAALSSCKYSNDPKLKM